MSSTSEPRKNTCLNVSNNKHSKCPPRMNDGRHFTDYRPQCHTNNMVQQNNDIHNSYQMRMFLTHNASELMKRDRKLACARNCCGPCQSPYQVGTMTPEKTARVANGPVPCAIKESYPAFGEAHGTAPLECASWNSSPIDAGSINCCSTVTKPCKYLPHIHGWCSRVQSGDHRWWSAFARCLNKNRHRHACTHDGVVVL